MNKVYCDRCGKEIPINNEGGCRVLPKYSVAKNIAKNIDTPYYRTTVDLCHDCEDELDEWFTCKNGGYKNDLSD